MTPDSTDTCPHSGTPSGQNNSKHQVLCGHPFFGALINVGNCLEIRSCVDWAWTVVLIECSPERIVPTHTAGLLPTGRTRVRMHEIVVLIYRLPLATPYPPCHERKTTQEYGTTDTNDHSNDDRFL